MPLTSKPIVLCISGHDPSGGAGIQADIETLSALGCHAATTISCLTIQDSRNVLELWPLKPDQIRQQAETLWQDYPIKAIKIGLIGSAAAAQAVADLLERHPDIPVVLDPILAAGGGTVLASQQLVETLLKRIIPLTTLVTPNSQEARKLTGLDALDLCAESLLNKGSHAVLITGTHEASEDVTHILYRLNQAPLQQTWPRLEGSYHGSGCTIASAIAAGLAKGNSLEESVSTAQRFTWESLAAGWQPGKGQKIPNRQYLNQSE